MMRVHLLSLRRRFSISPAAFLASALALLITAAGSPSPGQPIDGAKAVQLARDYLSTDDDAKRKSLAARLAEYRGGKDDFTAEFLPPRADVFPPKNDRQAVQGQGSDSEFFLLRGSAAISRRSAIKSIRLF